MEKKYDIFISYRHDGGQDAAKLLVEKLRQDKSLSLTAGHMSIDSDTDYSDNCVCTRTPRWTGSFRIKIVNRGSVYNRYVIRTN